MFTSYRQNLASFKRFSGIQRNFEVGFRCLVLLEKVSFDKIFEAVTQKLAIRCKCPTTTRSPGGFRLNMFIFVVSAS